MSSQVIFMASVIASIASTSPAPLGALQLEARLKHQADAWDQAIIRKDRPAIRSNIGDRFIQIGSDGGSSDKEAFIDGLMDEKLSIDPYQVEDLRVRVYGDTAILTGTTAMHGSYNGKAFSSHYRFTDVYVKQGESWRVVNVQTTPIR